MADSFTKVDGVEGSALGCDCYGGCWGDHSKDWPKLIFETIGETREAYRRCHQTETMGQHLPRERRVPYGSYIIMDKEKELRFATHALRNDHAMALLLGGR